MKDVEETRDKLVTQVIGLLTAQRLSAESPDDEHLQTAVRQMEAVVDSVAWALAEFTKPSGPDGRGP